jgi:hypothetical protein
MKINRDQFVEEGYVILRQAYEITAYVPVSGRII